MVGVATGIDEEGSVGITHSLIEALESGATIRVLEIPAVAAHRDRHGVQVKRDGGGKLDEGGGEAVGHARAHDSAGIAHVKEVDDAIDVLSDAPIAPAVGVVMLADGQVAEVGDSA